MKKSDSGITLVALVITIIILMILGTIATITGIEAVEESRLMTFKAEMKIMRLQLNSNDELEKYRKTDSDTLTDQQKLFLNKVQNELNNDNIQITLDIVNFKFFTKAQIKDLSSQEISTDLYINANTKTIISSIGVDYQGKTYYMLEQLPDNLYNVEEKIQNSGDVEFEVISKDKQIIISNIKYNAPYVEKGTIQYKLSTDEFWTTIAQDTIAKNYTFEVPTFGEYNIKITDAKNNQSIASVKVILKPYVLAETIRGANSPDISGFNVENTHYVTWGEVAPYQRNELNQTNTIDKEPPTGWSNYTEKKWANIITNGGENECYWVWIPRYAYKVPTKYTTGTPTAETIEVKFLQGTSNIPIGETEEITNTTPTPGTWVVHPAFTNEGNGGFGNLTGIWVAKFEASSNASNVVENPTIEQLAIDGGSDADTDLKVRVKPNVTSWRGIKVNDIFKVCQNLVEPNNSLCSTNNTKNTKLDSHMMKNTEWGAIAYLSMSVYGKNGEVWNNPYYNNATNYSPITGLCSNETDGKDKAYTATDITKTRKYNELGGGNASTTGNVYGVYDMAGGAWDYVAGILSSYKSNGDNTEKNNFYDFSNSSTYPNRYFNWYAGTEDSRNKNTNYNANSGKYGDAVYETSSSGDSNIGSWDSSFSYFPHSGYPVYVRGGGAYNGSYVGVFAFSFVTGQAFTYSSFRPCLVSH